MVEIAARHETATGVLSFQRSEGRRQIVHKCCISDAVVEVWMVYDTRDDTGITAWKSAGS